MKMAKNNQAFIGSLMALILGFFLLNAGTAYQESSKLYSAGFKELESMENLQSKYENISDNVTEISQKVGGIFWNIHGNKITFSETLPEKKKSENYSLELEKYKKFVQQNKGSLDVNISTEDLSSKEISIQPYDVNYGHPLYTGKNSKQQDTLEINPAKINFSGYSIQITLQNQAYESIVTNVQECSGGCLKPIFVDINIMNVSKVIQTQYTENNLDPNKVSTITLKTSGKSNNDVVITIGSSGKIKIQNGNQVPVELETTIDFGSGAEPEIKLANNSIQIGDYLGQRKT